MLRELLGYVDEYTNGQVMPIIEDDEDRFVERSLERWRDRDYAHIQDPWRFEPSQVKVWA